jgi:hypothetical protein
MPEIPISHQMSSARIAVGWPRTLFVLTAVLVMLVVGANILIAGYNRVLTSRSAEIERDIKALSAAVPAEDLNWLVKLDSQIQNLRLLLDRHAYLSRLLDELERLTLPQVRYTSADIDIANSSVSLRGIAPSLGDLSLQAAALRQSPHIIEVMVNSASTAVGGVVEFDMDLIFNLALVRPHMIQPTPTP